MSGAVIRRLLSLLFATFFFFGCDEPEVPVPPEPPVEEDPIVHVSVPGAYGVTGGDKILLPSSQTSVLIYGKSFSFRIIDPATQSVVSLSGLPVRLKAGDRVSLHYRLARGGRTLESQMYENLEVLQTSDSMAWLKENDEVFFVIQLF